MQNSILLDICEAYPHAVTAEKAQELYLATPAAYKEWVTNTSFVQFITSRARESFLWHDYEAGGTDAKRVAPMQCAMIRTDEHLNIIDIPIDNFCKLHGDRLPHPEAIRITGIDPLYCYENGLSEDLFFKAINRQMTFKNTVNTGYNSLSYDDEVSRFGFWRNLLPAYDREWANGCSRWDLYPVTAAYCALVQEGIVWPLNDDDKKTLKLELLAKANGIQQDNAHNALDDVKALIGWARLLKTLKPDLWQQLLKSRVKKYNQNLFKKGAIGWWVHNKVGLDSAFACPVILLGQIPGDANSWLYARLDQLDSIRACYRCDIAQIRERLFSKKEALLELDIQRPGIGTLKVNKQPQFFNEHDPMLHKEWLISQETRSAGLNLLNAADFVEKLGYAVSYDEQAPENDPTCALYQAGFPSEADKVSLRVFWTSNDPKTVQFQSDTITALANRVLWQRENGDDWKKYCAEQLTKPVEDNKHEAVNWSSIFSELEKSTIPENLKTNYLALLKIYSDAFGLPWAAG